MEETSGQFWVGSQNRKQIYQKTEANKKINETT